MLELNLLNQAEKFLKKLKKSDLQTAKQIVSKIIELQKEPSPTTLKKIVNHFPFRKIRFGKYRIVYMYDEKILYISLIEKRDVVYKQLSKFLK